MNLDKASNLSMLRGSDRGEGSLQKQSFGDDISSGTFLQRSV